MITSVVIILSMLLLSAFFSGMEIAFTSKNRLKLEIDRKQSRLFDSIADVFARHPGQYITTILVGNNIALVVYSLYMSLLLRGLFAAAGWEAAARDGSVLVETGVSTLIIIFCAEFLPKSVFRSNPNFYYRALAPVIYSSTSCSIPLRGSRRCSRTASCACSGAVSSRTVRLRRSTARTSPRCSTPMRRSRAPIPTTS